ncbi:MAG TPA: hypothetical protein PLZ55_16895 [bacterium]|nr:hypothetical protein [bacterium]
MNSIELKTSEITCRIGDNTANGEHNALYNGIWELRSTHEPVNLFVPSYAGLNLEHIFDGSANRGDNKRFFEPRHHPMELTVENDTATLHQTPTPFMKVESWTSFRVEEPNRIRFQFRARPTHTDFRFNYLGFFWASYILAPENKSIYFPTPEKNERGWRWYQHCTLAHNRDSSVLSEADNFQPAREDETEMTLYAACSPVRYARPFYFGLRGKMVLIYIFEKADGVLRLCHSPSGGGPTPDKMDTCPAWDFVQFIPNPEAGRTYELSLTAVYKLYEGRSDVIRQVETILGPQ